MHWEDTVSPLSIRQAVIERLALLSLDKQKEALAFIEDLASNEASSPPKARLTL